MSAIRRIGAGVVLLLCAACGSSPSQSPTAPSPTPGVSPTPAPASKAVYAYTSSFYDSLYVAGQDVVSAYTVDPSTGTWALVQSFEEPFASVALDPQGRFLFSGRWGVRRTTPAGYRRVAEVATYAIDGATGRLSPAAQLSIGDVDETTLVSSASGEWLYAADRSFDGMSVLSVDPASGHLAVIRRPDTVAPLAAAVDPAGRFLYLVDASSADPRDPRVVAYRVSGDGIPRWIGGVARGSRAVADAAGRHLYVARRPTRELIAFTIDAETGRLSDSVSVSTITKPGALGIHPGGRLLYLANDDDVVAYRLAEATGVPSLVGVVARGVSGELACDPLGRFLYVARPEAGGDVLGFAVDAATGSLVSIGTVAPDGVGWMGLTSRPLE
jgi:6-phosphogluconolactonase (cycloisomerase 2 family)